MLRSIPGFIRVADPAEVSPERWTFYPGTTIVVVDEFVFNNTWVLCPDKPCRLRLPGKNHYCRRPSVAAIKRTNGLWAYCADHLYGRVLVDGRLEAQVRVEDERVAHHRAERSTTLSGSGSATTGGRTRRGVTKRLATWKVSS